MTTTERSAEERGKSVPLTEPLPHLPADVWIGKDGADEPIGVIIEDGVPRPWYRESAEEGWWRATDEAFVMEILGRWGLAQRDIAAAERAARKAEEEVWLFAIGGADPARMEALRQARKVTHAALRALGVDP